MSRVTRGSLAREQAAESLPVANQEPFQLSSPPSTPERLSIKAPKSVSMRKKPSPAKALPVTPKSPRKRARLVLKDEDDVNGLPHNLGKIPELGAIQDDVYEESPAKKSRRRNTTKHAAPEESVQDLVAKATGTTEHAPKKVKKEKYVLTPGITPYPSWPHPTPEECEEVNRLLSSVHGDVKAPNVIPPPSLEVSGCGEVPSVLDAMIRTLLSAATSGTNAARAFGGLVKRFGILQEGVGKGSVDWNKVRLAHKKDIFEAIKSGGLADNKSKYIKEILQKVYEENQARREELLTSKDALESSDEARRMTQIAKAEDNVLSLDHFHLLSSDEAFRRLVTYPGIGAKTASCVTLFCLQRPSFAVDTHVFRFCEWLGWVPPPGDLALLPPGKKGKPTRATRNKTFEHCEVRIPDHLKYSLHQLFIKHGKTCPRCRSNTSETYADWDKGCVIDHLVTRIGKRKGGETSPAKGGKVARATTEAKVKKSLEYDSDAESSELSSPGSDIDNNEPADPPPEEEDEEDV